MLDITAEQLIRLEDVANYIPSRRKGKRLQRAVIFRWAKSGAGGVVLESQKIGGSWYTSVQAIQRFVERQNSFSADPQPPHLPKAVSRRSDAAASRKLEQLGI